MKNFIVLLSILLFTACSQHQVPLEKQSPQNKLTELLLNLDKEIRHKEASRLANELLRYGKELNTVYKRETSPLFHNFLVNTGVKKRGLCWHFSYDMVEFANTLHVKSFDFYIAGANIDKYWSEHNSLVVTCKGCAFEKGILIDPWRDTDRVYFSPLKKDSAYTWNQRGGLQNED